MARNSSPRQNYGALVRCRRYVQAEAMKAFDAGTNVPSQAKLNARDKAIVAQNPRQFNFSLWSGLTNWCIDQCFGEELAKQLVAIKLIKVEPRPVEKPPVAKPSEFDLKVAEAAGFHRAINIWNKMSCESKVQARQELQDQATELDKILSDYCFDEPNGLPGKFKHDHAADSPYRLSMPDRKPTDMVLAFNYYDVYWGLRN